LVTKETKIILKKGYLVGRFFGLAWAGLYCLLFIYTMISDVTNPAIPTLPSMMSQIPTPLLLMQFLVIFIVISELFAPAIGIFAILIQLFIEKRFGDKTKTTFWTLFLTGVLFSFVSFYIFGMMNSIKSPQVDYYVFDTFIFPLVIPLFVALLFFISYNELSKKQIKIHIIIRFIVIIAPFGLSMMLVLFYSFSGAFSSASALDRTLAGASIVYLIISAIFILISYKFKKKIFFYFPLGPLENNDSKKKSNKELAEEYNRERYGI